MKQMFGDEITLVDVRVLAASIYEREVRLWMDNQWCCPQCQVWNGHADVQCACGISRDGLPEFCERLPASVTAA